MDIIDNKILINKEEIQALNDFISNWVRNYVDELVQIPMFDIEKTKLWNNAQKIYFAKTFYHAKSPQISLNH